MEIRKQLLGIVIGIFITLSFAQKPAPLLITNRF